MEPTPENPETTEAKDSKAETPAHSNIPVYERSEDPSVGSHQELRDKIIEQIKTVFDPEIPINIYEVGLIYDIQIDDAGAVKTFMTLTAPNCPAAGTLPGEVEQKIAAVEGVTSSEIKVVWEPTWIMSMMSEAARLELGLV